MDREYRETLSANRRRLQNPYAHVDELESDGTEAVAAGGLQQRIHNSRRLLENPYAYAVDDGFAALSAGFAEVGRAKGDAPARSPAKLSLRSKAPQPNAIESAVSSTHRLVWKHRDRVGHGGATKDPIELLDPAIALSLLGFGVEISEGLGNFRKDRQLIEVAGLIDMDQRLVKISGQFPRAVRRFTLAHELAHAVLHGSLSGVHRDRPVDGLATSRSSTEREADRFASLYLMPERLVKQHFESRFGRIPFVLSEANAFALGGEKARTLASNPTERAIAQVLAGTERFNGRHFTSLADQFGVSVTAMSIRLDELGLIDSYEQP